MSDKLYPDSSSNRDDTSIRECILHIPDSDECESYFGRYLYVAGKHTINLLTTVVTTGIEYGRVRHLYPKIDDSF